jgi:hypothetical protein
MLVVQAPEQQPATKSRSRCLRLAGQTPQLVGNPATHYLLQATEIPTIIEPVALG